MAKCIECEMYRVGRFSGCSSVTPGHAVEPSGFSVSPEHSPLPRPHGAPPSPQPPLQLRTPGASREWNHVGLVLLCPVTEHHGLWTQPGWSGRGDFLPAQAEQPPRTADRALWTRAPASAHVASPAGAAVTALATALTAAPSATTRRRARSWWSRRISFSL